MVYSNDIFAILSNDSFLNFSSQGQDYGGNVFLYAQNASRVRMALPRSGTIKGFKSWLRLNQFANNSNFDVMVNNVSQYNLYYGTSVTGVLEDISDYVVSAGDDIHISHTEDAFSGSYEGYANVIGVYD
jgi:hypothetical protein